MDGEEEGEEEEAEEEEANFAVNGMKSFETGTFMVNFIQKNFFPAECLNEIDAAPNIKNKKRLLFVIFPRLVVIVFCFLFGF